MTKFYVTDGKKTLIIDRICEEDAIFAFIDRCGPIANPFLQINEYGFSNNVISTDEIREIDYEME
jgi:hypothetical protein